MVREMKKRSAMSNKRLALMIAAIALLLPVCFFSYVLMHFGDIDPDSRYDFTPAQQEKIARALGFVIAPGGKLTAYYYPGVWPGTIEALWVNAPGRAELYIERGDARLKKVQGIINNQGEPWLFCIIFCGSLVTEAVLIAALIVTIVKRRKARKEKPPAGFVGAKKIFTVATAHLDTSWLWTLETTIKHLLPNTMRRNFKLFEKYPEYRFNFEGAYRYELMEEYYPEEFARLKEYVAQGRWVPTGSAYENGDVNMPSPEALFRSILLGNNYFEKTFGIRCVDIFLPDCFGFGYALPAVMAHSGLYGFATCKLTWGSAVGRPFDIGRWTGVDGSDVFASIRPGPYGASPGTARGDKGLLDKLERNAREHSMPFTCRMYGTGDMGGAPSRYSVRYVNKEVQENGANDIQIISSRARDVFDAIKNDLTQDELAALPTHDGEFLLTDHGVGSYTSRAIGHRWNRRCEQLADAAERALVAADWLGAAEYPKARLNEAWKRVLAHHFHDDLTGTSFQACYKRSWNDYVLSMNQLAEEYAYTNRAVASALDTSFTQGTPVIVNNTLQYARVEAVSVALPFDTESVKVADSQGLETPAQVSGRTVTFLADLAPLSWKIYDIQIAQSQLKNHLKITENSLENENLAVAFDADGDIISIFDKKNKREALSGPIRMVALPDNSSKWPAWELRYDDVMSGDRRYPAGAEFRIIESGPARATLKITRRLGTSNFTQRVSLDAGGTYVKCYNEVDWRETGTLLKAEFPLSVSNENAAYDLGLGAARRPTNTPKLYEVPLQNWMDISENHYGVSVLNDSKSGADKPADDTLRLTLLHTPAWPYRWECSQHLMDLGLNRFSFGVYPHAGGYSNGTQAAAAAFNQPLQPFVTDRHPGALGAEYAFGSLRNHDVILRAIKKAEHDGRVVVRFNEGSGKEAKGVRFTLGEGIERAEETLAVETYLRDAAVEDGELVFDMRPFEVKTFALTLKAAKKITPPRQEAVSLPYNVVGVTPNGRHGTSELLHGYSIPMEIYPDTIMSGGVCFTTQKDGKNAMACRGQTIPLPEGAKRAHLLMCSLAGDTCARFVAGEAPVFITVQDASQAIGRWDLIGLGEMGHIKRDVLAWNATHIHCKGGEVPARQFYLFKHTIDLDGARSLTVPEDECLAVFALTADFGGGVFYPGGPLYDELEERPWDYELPPEVWAKASPTRLECLLERVVSRGKIITISLPKVSGCFSVADAHAAIRQAVNKRRSK